MNTEYYMALEKFTDAIAAVNTLNQKQVNEAMIAPCTELGVSYVEVVFYDSLKHESQGKGKTFVCYDDKSGGDVVFENRIVSDAMNVAICTMKRSGGKSEWGRAEQDKATLLHKMILIFLDRLRLKAIAEKYTYYDDDGYYNLRFFLRYMDRLAMEGNMHGKAAIHFNLKHFAAINQQVGRATGTYVMCRFIEELIALLTGGGIICRVGGDNFIGMVAVSDLDNVIKHLSGARIVYDNESGSKIAVSASAGIFVLPEDFEYNDASDIMDKIISASQAARSNGKKEIVFFDDVMIARKARVVKIQQMFPQALENEEFLVYYQPKVSIDGGILAGAEALCRWMHNGEIIPPGDFIPMLEQGMDICKLDFYMLDHVCRDIRRWLDEGRDVVRISVNLSRKHMMDLDLLERIIEIIDKHNVPHKYIEIELTETTTDVEFRDLKRVVRGLQEAGIYTSVDDFGIGYSSLNLIKEIPWNVLKVDRSFLPEDTDDPGSRRSVMFKYVVAMAQELGLECIAEGVETKSQVDILKENSCDMAQGFYFDRPLPINEFEKRLDEHKYKSV